MQTLHEEYDVDHVQQVRSNVCRSLIDGTAVVFDLYKLTLVCPPVFILPWLLTFAPHPTSPQLVTTPFV